MANDTYTIIYYDSNDTAHTTALADLVTAGGVDVGDGIVDSASAYFGTGIYDGTTQYATGIYDGTTQYATGIYDGTTQYATGIYNGTYQTQGILATDGSWQELGISYWSSEYVVSIANTGTYDGTTYNAYGIIYDNGGTPAYAQFGISDGPYYYATGVAAPYTYYPYGILYDNGGTPTYSSAGIRSDDGIFNGNGILYYDGVSYIYAQDGIYDGTTQYATGIYDGTTQYATGIYNGTYQTQGILATDGSWQELGISYWSSEYVVSIANTGILYDNLGTPTYEAIGTYDGTDFHYDGIMFAGMYHDYGIVSYNGGAANYNDYGILDSTDTYYATGILDGSGGYYTVGIWDGSIAQAYYSEGIWDGVNYYADGCWNTTTDTYYPIQALDVLGGGLA